MPDSPKVNVFWFRRDLRLEDNAGLYHALRSGLPVLPLFIFDTEILDRLPVRTDARVEFIHQAITALDADLRKLGSGLRVRHGRPDAVWRQLLLDYDVGEVYLNRDYEPGTIARDKKVAGLLSAKGIRMRGYKDHVIFDRGEVLKDDGTPYTVFTPYSRKWKRKLESGLQPTANGQRSFFFKSYPTLSYGDRLLKGPLPAPPTLADIGFAPAGIDFPAPAVADSLLEAYADQRDFPAVRGTSRLGIHLRFGTISVRALARRASKHSGTYLNELIWRDFYSMILQHFPHVASEPFRAQYAAIPWRNDEVEFEAWCEGRTGYPLVDAGMRELSTTGFMHNRVRMVTASFLSKHLLIDWRWGEQWFADKLLDFDLASNNGGWQWAAGCGTDAAPYFRIFNPESQMKKFDKTGAYVRRWVPEYGTPAYPRPIVEHKFARERCLNAYKVGLGKA